MKKIVITGPTGAIGTALIKKCIQENVSVLAICRRGSSRIDNLPKSKLVTVLEADLSELDKLKMEAGTGQLMGGSYDVFCHLGWNGTFGDKRDDMYLQNENVRFMLDAVHLAHALGCHTFIGAGSQAEYGRVEGKLRPDTPVNPENGYGMAKLCAGLMSRKECGRLGIRHIWTRILSVYGPGDGMNSMIMSALESMLKGAKTSFTKGEQLWDYLYSGDAAEALYLLGERGADGEVYCIGSGQARPLREYIEIMKKVTGTKAALGLGEVPYGEKQVMHLCADIEALTKDTGFHPKVVFEEGVKETMEWIRIKQAL